MLLISRFCPSFGLVCCSFFVFFGWMQIYILLSKPVIWTRVYTYNSILSVQFFDMFFFFVLRVLWILCILFQKRKKQQHSNPIVTCIWHLIHKILLETKTFWLIVNRFNDYQWLRMRWRTQNSRKKRASIRKQL